MSDQSADGGELRTDGGIAVGSYQDLGPDQGQPIDRNPAVPCKICGESFNWQDYWKDRALAFDDPENAPFWCGECEEEIQTIRRRLSNNSRITDYACPVGETIEHDGGEQA